ncbi:hypothetical protein BKG89_10485 [Rodentibacter caecimuris]|uniref:Redoxin domain-containing protein n=2 Tax=Rodentibacter caecimuris TaxID=1796644 RepID=A0ABX3KXV3_9PAST|nr:hypothetical protein BKG89_10485 [Rodentibacter heylii]
MALSFNLFASEKVNFDNIQFKDLNNNIVSLAQFKGQPAYVKMWASWCPICLSGLFEIDDLTAENNKNFSVITIVSPGHKGEKSLEKFIDWYKGLEYKNVIVLLDESGETIKRAKVRGYPFNLVLDKELHLVKTVPGHLTAPQIKEMFASE